jgi:tetratricopeptide (TPR) repeat protein
MRITAKSFSSVLLILIAAFSAACVRQQVRTSPAAADATAHLEQGLAYFKQNEYGRARAEFETVLAAEPVSGRVMNLIGLTYFHQKNYRQAAEWFRKAASVQPDYAPAQKNLGSAYAMMRLFERARQAYEKALALNPASASTYFSLASVCFELGDRDKAAAYLATGLELDPDFLQKSGELVDLPMSGSSLAEMYFSYARFYAGRGNLERTVEYLDRAKDAGFRDWGRVRQEKEFAPFLESPEMRKFLKD